MLQIENFSKYYGDKAAVDTANILTVQINIPLYYGFRIVFYAVF